jgi:hypothetical protein
MNKFLKDLVTVANGVDFDVGRVSWVLSWAGVSAGAAWLYWHGPSPSISELAAAYGTVAGAHAGALWAKAKTEPQQ